ncbi:hypothetical protein ABT294_12510 [Nonomuraea sp. NPDC000554]|uniref:hypothetical protein n=1 Tax=Nonomuraea sp. NPDC000554 TaxID=3154259 RepID=UPI003318D6F0
MSAVSPYTARDRSARSTSSPTPGGSEPSAAESTRTPTENPDPATGGQHPPARVRHLFAAYDLREVANRANIA